ncbi:hypothetical protein PGT21_008665 [Puccinia graminis f. sp. tritici]|uniref:Uncharacterized protein n=1 Tax=Puccinia graminis f. sp. tritici TaxID=56615 RepID=A0A5B0R010_PUCGR|nr:hypothetical protein PGT21_008665 [Puccinia graminis f. sp. tritici]
MRRPLLKKLARILVASIGSNQLLLPNNFLPSALGKPMQDRWRGPYSAAQEIANHPAAMAPQAPYSNVPQPTDPTTTWLPVVYPAWVLGHVPVQRVENYGTTQPVLNPPTQMGQMGYRPNFATSWHSEPAGHIRPDSLPRQPRRVSSHNTRSGRQTLSAGPGSFNQRAPQIGPKDIPGRKSSQQKTVKSAPATASDSNSLPSSSASKSDQEKIEVPSLERSSEPSRGSSLPVQEVESVQQPQGNPNPKQSGNAQNRDKKDNGIDEANNFRNQSSKKLIRASGNDGDLYGKVKILQHDRGSNDSGPSGATFQKNKNTSDFEKPTASRGDEASSNKILGPNLKPPSFPPVNKDSRGPDAVSHPNAPKVNLHANKDGKNSGLSETPNNPISFAGKIKEWLRTPQVANLGKAQIKALNDKLFKPVKEDSKDYLLASQESPVEKVLHPITVHEITESKPRDPEISKVNLEKHKVEEPSLEQIQHEKLPEKAKVSKKGHGHNRIVNNFLRNDLRKASKDLHRDSKSSQGDSEEWKVVSRGKKTPGRGQNTQFIGVNLKTQLSNIGNSQDKVSSEPKSMKERTINTVGTQNGRGNDSAHKEGLEKKEIGMKNNSLHHPVQVEIQHVKEQETIKAKSNTKNKKKKKAPDSSQTGDEKLDGVSKKKQNIVDHSVKNKLIGKSKLFGKEEFPIDFLEMMEAQHDINEIKSGDYFYEKAYTAEECVERMFNELFSIPLDKSFDSIEVVLKKKLEDYKDIDSIIKVAIHKNRSQQQKDSFFIDHISKHLKSNQKEDHIGIEEMKDNLYILIMMCRIENKSLFTQVYNNLKNSIGEDEAFRRIFILSKQFAQKSINKILNDVKRIDGGNFYHSSSKYGEYEKSFGFFEYYGINNKNNIEDEFYSLEHQYIVTHDPNQQNPVKIYLFRFLFFELILGKKEYWERSSPRIHFTDTEFIKSIENSNYRKIMKEKEFLHQLDSNGISLNRVLTVILILGLEDKGWLDGKPTKHIHYMAKVLAKVIFPNEYNYLPWVETPERNFLKKYYREKYDNNFEDLLMRLRRISISNNEAIASVFPEDLPKKIIAQSQLIQNDSEKEKFFAKHEQQCRNRVFDNRLLLIDEFEVDKLASVLKDLESKRNFLHHFQK